MGLRVKSMNWVVEKVSKVRRFRQLIGDIDELLRFLGVVNGGRNGFGGVKWTVREGHHHHHLLLVFVGGKSHSHSCSRENLLLSFFFPSD